MNPSSMGRLGSHPAAVWTIKHLISPLDRLVVRLSRGRIPQPSSIILPTLLLTTVGHRSGRPRTIPLIYLHDSDRYIVANARPAGERANPWVTNLRAAGTAQVRRGRTTTDVTANELEESQIDTWWPALTDLWPAFEQHYQSTGERTVFVLEPRSPTPTAREAVDIRQS